MAGKPEKSQREKFEEAAREIGADEDARAYEDAVEKVANAPKLTDEELKAIVRKRRYDKGGAK